MYLAAFEHGQRVETNRLDQFQPHVWISFRVSTQERRKYRFKLEGRGRHPQLPGISASKDPHPLAKGVGVAQQAAAIHEQLFTLRRQDDAATDAIKKLEFEFLLQLADLARQTRANPGHVDP